MNSRTFDVRASDTEVALICDVPGVEQEDLQITLTNQVLITIRIPKSPKPSRAGFESGLRARTTPSN